MRYEYAVKIFSMDELRVEGVIVDPEKNIVYACKPEGVCEVRDIAAEQLENLSGLFNRVGKEGWELVQLFFRPLGVVSFWKKPLNERNEHTT
jgi:hypothetical protein